MAGVTVSQMLRAVIMPVAVATLIPFGTLFAFPASAVLGDESATLDALANYLAQPVDSRGNIIDQPFATMALSRDEAKSAVDQLWADYVKRLRDSRKEEMDARVLQRDTLKMPFYYEVFGEKPDGGRSLFISMHGGGGAPAQINDRQWENQKKLYQPAEGVYLAPRAPTDTWNLWHQDHIDWFFDRLIANLVVWEDVNPNRVYIMGYSAGGDGVYQLAPRMADRWAAAAMMAGHPNETVPFGLRNIGFTLHMGGRDAAYNRNETARQWKQRLAELKQADPTGYEHLVVIHEEKSHWMDREDAVAVPWMAKFTRQPYPEHIVWYQDDVTHDRFYWLGNKSPQPGDHLVAKRDQQNIQLEANRDTTVRILLNDMFVDLDQPVRVAVGDKMLFEGKVSRTVANLATTLEERGDRDLVFSGVIEVPVPARVAEPAAAADAASPAK